MGMDYKHSGIYGAFERHKQNGTEHGKYNICISAYRWTFWRNSLLYSNDDSYLQSQKNGKAAI